MKPGKSRRPILSYFALPQRSIRVRKAVLLILAIAGSPATNVQANAPAVTDRNATVVAGRRYEAGPFTRMLFGNGWRPVWTAPVTVPVFDMSSYAGGVKP